MYSRFSAGSEPSRIPTTFGAVTRIRTRSTGRTINVYPASRRVARWVAALAAATSSPKRREAVSSRISTIANARSAPAARSSAVTGAVIRCIRFCHWASGRFVTMKMPTAPAWSAALATWKSSGTPCGEAVSTCATHAPFTSAPASGLAGSVGPVNSTMGLEISRSGRDKGGTRTMFTSTPAFSSTDWGPVRTILVAAVSTAVRTTP
jgi:hypothetical protein